MPRYFFDVHDGSNSRDRDGVDLLDIATAKVVATSYAACLLKDDPKRFWSDCEWHLRVRGEGGSTLFEIAFFASTAPQRSLSLFAEETSNDPAIEGVADDGGIPFGGIARDQRRGIDEVTSQSLGVPSTARSRAERGA